MPKIKLLLLSPPEPPGYRGYRLTFNLAIVRLASFVKKKFSNIDIKILDPLITDLHTMQKVLYSDFPGYLGISVNSFNYANGLNIARIAKKNGWKVILGGPHATNAADLIRIRRSNIIDYVIAGRGEGPLVELLKGNDPLKKNHHPSFSEIAEIDMRIVPRESLRITLNHKPDRSDFRRVLPYQFTVGCPFQSGGKACIYCAVPDKHMELIEPELFWPIIMRLQKDYRVKIIYEVGDCFGFDFLWLEKLASFKPKGSRMSFWVYCRSDLLNQERINLFKFIGVNMVYLGLESGSDELLLKANKLISSSDMLRSIGMLDKAGIYTTGSFVFGLPGESRKTLSETVILMKNILKYKHIYSIGGSLIFPYIGSRAYFDLIDTDSGSKFRHDDDPDPWSMQEEYVNNFCLASKFEIESVMREIHILSPASPITRDRY